MMFDDVDSPWELEDDEITIESSRVRLAYGSKASIRVSIANLVQRGRVGKGSSLLPTSLYSSGFEIWIRCCGDFGLYR
jgi:hypothetical protein